MAAILESGMTRYRIYRQAVAAALILLLSACSGLKMPDTSGVFGSTSLAPQPGDPCASERSAFSSSQSYFGEDLVSETLMGGVASMASDLTKRLGGGSTANLTSGLRQDAFSGARAGYLSALAKRSGSKQEMLQQMNGDLRQEDQQVDSLQTSFQRLQSCRFQQARMIKTEARSGRITHAQADEQLAAQRQLFDAELAVAKQSNRNLRRRDEQFQYAADELNQQSQPPAVSKQTKQAAVVANVTLPRKRETFASTVSDAGVRSKSDLGDVSAS